MAKAALRRALGPQLSTNTPFCGDISDIADVTAPTSLVSKTSTQPIDFGEQAPPPALSARMFPRGCCIHRPSPLSVHGPYHTGLRERCSALSLGSAGGREHAGARRGAALSIRMTRRPTTWTRRRTRLHARSRTRPEFGRGKRRTAVSKSARAHSHEPNPRARTRAHRPLGTRSAHTRRAVRSLAKQRRS